MPSIASANATQPSSTALANATLPSSTITSTTVATSPRNSLYT